MAFSGSRYTDASGSTFNDVGRDQTHNSSINNYQSIHVHLSVSGSGPTLHHLLLDISDDVSSPASNSETVSRGRVLSTTYHSSESETVFAVETVVGLIVQIMHLLIDRKHSASDRRDLELELKSLQQTLTLTGLAIQEYSDRPLGQSMANAITPHVEQCRVVLLDLLDRVNGTRQGLFSTNIRDLWRPVWWDGEDLASLRMKLCRIRTSFGRLLMALNSYAFTCLPAVAIR